MGMIEDVRKCLEDIQEDMAAKVHVVEDDPGMVEEDLGITRLDGDCSVCGVAWETSLGI
jgi:hypothetical protein